MSGDLDVRRPELLGVRRTGTVRGFKEEKGYGRISADDGEVLFVHFSDIVADGYRSLVAERRVEFIWPGAIADHGPSSLSVEPDNYARHLYERVGFQYVGEVSGSLTMLLRLDVTADRPPTTTAPSHGAASFRPRAGRLPGA